MRELVCRRRSCTFVRYAIMHVHVYMASLQELWCGNATPFACALECLMCMQEVTPHRQALSKREQTPPQKLHSGHAGDPNYAKTVRPKCLRMHQGGDSDPTHRRPTSRSYGLEVHRMH